MTDAVRKLENSTSKRELRSFLVLFNVLRWIVPSFTRLAASLNEGMTNDQLKKFGSLDIKASATVAS